MIKAAIACYWAATRHERRDTGDDPSYIGWDAAKFVVRSVTTVFLMGLFMQVNAKAFPLKNPNKPINYILEPARMLGIISLFLESLVDQYLGLDEVIRLVMVRGRTRVQFSVHMHSVFCKNAGILSGLGVNFS